MNRAKAMNRKQTRGISLQHYIIQWLGLIAIAVMLFGCGQDKEQVVLKAELNKPAPDFTLVDLKGRSWKLSELRGKVVFINFWATWCPPCIKEMPSLERLQEKLEDQPFTILTVNVGEPKYKVWKFTRLIDFTLPVLLDTRSEAFTGWDASVLPTSFLLDTEGRIRYQVVADLEWDSERVVSLIRTLLPQQETP